ncbi:MAG: response regulator [Deferribacteres bacterium]|nr:response regulator [candidate division KSB1 bacterium]MCB9500593.1 response regulator [Deferribacteres bacterium]
MSKNPTICAIDDEQVILDSIKKLCSAENWDVDITMDAAVGLDKMKTDKYNLAICDIMMPGMDGFEFLQQVQKMKIKTPVIITTGFSTLENAVKSLYSGAIDFLPKPFTFEELISVVGRGLQYEKIQSLIDINPMDSDTRDEQIYYIPCPPRYNRLGYSAWTFLEDDGYIKIGVTDLFLRTIDLIEEVELMKPEEEIFQGNTCAFIKTQDGMTHNILAPVSGRIIQRNERILEDFTLMEKDPYFKGWLYSVVPANLEYETKYLVPCSSDRNY